jgi:DNA repair protein SbcD/Mre11
VITAILTSDNHLGANYARFRPDRLELRRKRLRQAFERVVDAAIARKVDLFLHAGDLFDRPDPRNDERHFVAQQLRRLRDAGIPVYAIAGNHDTPRSYGYGGGITPQQEADALGGLHLFRNSDELAYQEQNIRGQRVRIWGMSSDFNRLPESCPLEGLTLERENWDVAQILLLHYGVEGWMQAFDDESREPILSLHNLERMAVDVIGVGHLHVRKQRRMENGALVINSGSTERMDFGEEGLECGYAVITLDGKSASTETVRVPTQPMRTLKYEIGTDPQRALTTEQESEAAQTLLDSCVAELDRVAHPDQLLRMRFSGQMPRNLYHAFPWEALQKRGSAANFHFQLENNVTVFDPDSDLPLGYGVSFDVAEELQNMMQAFCAQYEGNEQEQALYQQAHAEICVALDRLTGGNRS